MQIRQYRMRRVKGVIYTLFLVFASGLVATNVYRELVRYLDTVNGTSTPFSPTFQHLANAFRICRCLTDQLALIAYLSFLGFYLKMKKRAMAWKR
jgi:hypothetical protein